jgi:hypothetical protein
MTDHRCQKSGVIYLIHFETKLHHAGPRLCPICRANLGLHARQPDSQQLAF